MRIEWLAMVAAVTAAAPAAAHDFWIQPARFSVAAGAPVPFTLLVGHGKFRQRWGVESTRVLRFADAGGPADIDYRRVLHTESGDDDGTLRLLTPGTHVIVLESGPALSVLPSIRFNDYLKVEGLTPAIAQRARAGRNGAEGREFYSRRAKTLIRVTGPTGTGNAGTGNAETSATSTTGASQVTRPTGLKLEIVPQKNPYDLKAGEALPVQILYEGRPLSGATVRLTDLNFDAEPFAKFISDANGRASFNVPPRGLWQLNVVWTKPLIGNPQADFDTVFSSLTFGFDRPLPPPPQ